MIARTLPLSCLCLCLCLSGLLLLSAGVGPAAAVADEWPEWVDREEQDRQRIAQVNEGELQFLSQPPPTAVHHHRSHIVIGPQSLRDGWVVMRQCHDHLDRVGAAQIVFNPQRSRALEVVSYRNMEQAYAEGSTVQLRDIRDESQLCLRVETRALDVLAPSVFELHNGPFMRRFLDGYYPLRLSLRVDYPAALALADFTPDAQPGFHVREHPGSIEIEALFEGRLQTSLRFLSD